MELTIETIAFGGSGIARSNGKVVFVPFTAPGDTVEAVIESEKKAFIKAKLGKVLSPSPMRTTPRCPHFSHCGGCQFQHLSYENQLTAKKSFVTDALTRVGKVTFPPISMHASPEHWHYRTHVRMNLTPKDDGFEAVYIGEDNTSTIKVEACPISKLDTLFLDRLQTHLKTLSSKGVRGASLRIFSLVGKPVLAISTAPHMPQNAKVWAEKSLHFVSGVFFKSPNGSFSCGNTPLTYTPSAHTETTTTTSLEFFFSPFGFMQCNFPVADAIYAQILSLLSSCTTIIDLYGGVGILSLKLAEKGKTVTLIEANPNACKEAASTAQKHALPLTVISSTVEEANLAKYPADAIVLNPPREGLTPLALQAVIKKAPNAIVYVSCMPATLARDLAAFTEGGYSISCVDAYDMFPQTTHVETLIFLHKKKHHEHGALRK